MENSYKKSEKNNTKPERSSEKGVESATEQQCDAACIRGARVA